MAKAKKQPETLPATEQHATSQLIAVLQSLTQEVEMLTRQVGKLTDHAQVLTEAIDDVRMELEHALKNLARPAWVPTQAVTSMARDTMAPDFGERINQVKAKDSHKQEPPPLGSDEDRQRDLWD